MDSSSLFAVNYELLGEQRFLVWIEGEPDSVAVTHRGNIATFRSLPALEDWLASRGESRHCSVPVYYNLEAVRSWCEAPAAASVDCTDFYNSWNLLLDACRAARQTREFSAAARDLHEKLFWGCNVPAMTPRGQSFQPSWCEGELVVLAGELRACLEVFAGSVEDAA